MQDIDIKSLKPGDILEFEGVFQVSPYGWTSINSGAGIPDYVTIAPVKISVTVPDGFNGITAMVQVLDDKAEAVRKEADGKILVLTKQKNDLLQLSYGGQEILDAEA
jgi:hypothetical protein